jgi:thioredoxin:protein disulfide reductase
VDAKVNFLLAVLGGVIIISLAMSLRSCGTPAVPEIFDRRISLEEAIARGNRDERPVFVLFTADWCSACSALKKGALANSGVQEWVREHAVPAYVDVTKAQAGDMEARVLQTRYRIEALPTILILKKGQEVGRITGNVPRRELLKYLRQISDPE